MDKRQERTLRSLRNAVHLLGAHKGALGDEGRALHEQLREITTTIETLAAHQLRRDHPGPHFRHHAERFREKYLLPLADLARPHFAGDKEMLAALKIPHKRQVGEFHEAAIRLLKKLTPHRAYLKQMGVDTRRIQRLREETKLLRARYRELYARSPASRLATPAMKEAFKSARRFLVAADRLILDSLDRDTYDRWKSGTRITKRLGRPRKKKRPPPE